MTSFWETVSVAGRRLWRPRKVPTILGGGIPSRIPQKKVPVMLVIEFRYQLNINQRQSLDFH